jgi:repressor LexA
MTPKQKKMYDAICTFMADKGYSPSYRELADMLDIRSTSQIHNALGRMEKQGLITRTRGQSRSIELVAASPHRIKDILQEMKDTLRLYDRLKLSPAVTVAKLRNVIPDIEAEL